MDGSWLYRVHGGCVRLEKFGKTKVGVFGNMPNHDRKNWLFLIYVGGLYINILYTNLPELRFDKLPKILRTWKEHRENMKNTCGTCQFFHLFVGCLDRLKMFAHLKVKIDILYSKKLALQPRSCYVHKGHPFLVSQLSIS